MPEPSLIGVLGRPVPEALAALRTRLARLVPTERWTDLQREAHDRAFVVAGAQSAELLTDLAAAVDQVIAQGRGLEDFRRDFKQIIEARGWSGWTGDGSPTGRAWRTQVIYQTNLATTYAAARREQLAGLRWWIYRHSHLSREPRAEHLAWDGRIVAATDPWWDTHYPPNGWGCRCYVTGAPTLAAARLLGGRVVGAPTAPDDTTGIDPGWDYAPGASVQPLIRAVAAQAARWPRPVLAAYVPTLGVERADQLAVAIRGLPSTEQRVGEWAAAVRAFGAESRVRPDEIVSLAPLTSAERAELELEGEVLDWAADWRSAREIATEALARLPRALRRATLRRRGGVVEITTPAGSRYVAEIDPTIGGLVVRRAP